jgi:hypothetical protein
MNARVGLERWYRRLLVMYPPGHRQLHGEEMVGVLLAGTQDGQRRPGLADTADLIGGALRIRLRAIGRGSGDPRWRDALAVLSVVAPLLLLAAGLATNDLLGVAIRAVGGSVENPFWLGYWWVWPSTFGPAILVLLVLLRLRRSAAAAALATTAGYVIISAAGSAAAGLASTGVALWGLLGGLATVALALSPGPRRGLRILGWWRTALVAAGALALGALAWGDPRFIAPLPRPGQLIGILVILAGVAVACLRTPVGRRVVALLMIVAIPLCFGVLAEAGARAGWMDGSAQRAALLYLPPLLGICLIMTAARLGRHRLDSQRAACHDSPPRGGDTPA